MRAHCFWQGVGLYTAERSRRASNKALTSCHAFSSRVVSLDCTQPALLSPARIAEQAECALSLRRHRGEQLMLQVALWGPSPRPVAVHTSWIVQAWAGTWRPCQLRRPASPPSTEVGPADAISLSCYQSCSTLGCCLVELQACTQPPMEVRMTCTCLRQHCAPMVRVMPLWAEGRSDVCISACRVLLRHR